MRLRVYQQLRPDMLRVVNDGDLPGDIAVICQHGEFTLFVTSGALKRIPPRELAHSAAHMLQGGRSCGAMCRGFTARIETCLLAVAALVNAHG